ncbi:MAG: benzoate-CoA ligase family protein [Candidatus Promineifilaceae bacterium]|nr:benzoate-CoA ligase family protein [Candidatus Promineifilaceae bacterium]
MRASELPLYYNAVEILEHNLPKRAEKMALFSPSRNLTFQELSEEVNQVGNALQELGVRQGETVGLLTWDSPEWVTVFFGTLKIGAVHMGMNTLLTPPEFDYVLKDSRARVLVVHQDLLPKIKPVLDEQPYLEHIIVVDSDEGDEYQSYEAWIAGQAAELERALTHREDYATLNYSSGTTGQPKGILHAHKDLPITASLWGKEVLGLKESDRTFAVAKLFFTFGTGGNLIFPLFVGASIVLYPGSPREMAKVLAMVDRFQPTIFYNSPTGYAIILAIDNFAEKYDLSSLRLCVSAGEALPAPLWKQWKEQTGLDTLDGIGSTEVYHIFISNRPDDIRPGSSGQPVPGYRVKIVDEEGRPVEQGEIGNLLVNGESVALSYLHQYERSRQTFRGEWLFTGDKYYVDEDGYYWHAGRSDDMIKAGGIWVSPMEVESTLISHPAVVECAVVGREDRSDLTKPQAFVVLKAGYTPSEELEQELIAYARERMAGYKRPRWVTFVDELPKTATGKIQRFRLRRRAEEMHDEEVAQLSPG